MGPEQWWQHPSVQDGVDVALGQITEARSNRRARNWELQACRDAFDALNQLATCFDALHTHPEPGPDAASGTSENAKHAKLLAALPGEAQVRLLGEPHVHAFAMFVPEVLSHRTRGMNQGSIDDLPSEVIREAGRGHRHFRESWINWRANGSQTQRTLQLLARALLVVRNNLAHGEKTLAGPDRTRRERNRAVASTVLAVLDEVLDAVLGRPSEKLVAYGTLLLESPNSPLAEVSGRWTPVTLRGSVWDEQGIPAFESSSRGDPIPARLLESTQLPELWQRLDEIEGQSYARCLGWYDLSGHAGIANVYEWVGNR